MTQVFIFRTINDDTGEAFCDAYKAESNEQAERQAHEIGLGIDWGQTGIASSVTVNHVCTLASDAATLAENFTQ